jgi:hypothetical protein
VAKLRSDRDSIVRVLVNRNEVILDEVGLDRRRVAEWRELRQADEFDTVQARGEVARASGDCDPIVRNPDDRNEELSRTSAWIAVPPKAFAQPGRCPSIGHLIAGAFNDLGFNRRRVTE